MQGLLIDCVVKSPFENFEKIFSKRLKWKLKKGNEKKQNQTFQPKQPNH
jgi:hypothetical protein